MKRPQKKTLLRIKSKFIVVTGGPGAGKTAILKAAHQMFFDHVAVLPEAATILFGGGFPRRPTRVGKETAQRAVFHLQRELERLFSEDKPASAILCDRGTLDGLAYWPGTPQGFFEELGTDYKTEFARYHMVIHLHTPGERRGYNHVNPIRIETPAEAALIDEKIIQIWMGHPNFHLVGDTEFFEEKTKIVLDLIRLQIPGGKKLRHSPAKKIARSQS